MQKGKGCWIGHLSTRICDRGWELLQRMYHSEERARRYKEWPSLAEEYYIDTTPFSYKDLRALEPKKVGTE